MTRLSFHRTNSLMDDPNSKALAKASQAGKEKADARLKQLTGQVSPERDGAKSQEIIRWTGRLVGRPGRD